MKIFTTLLLLLTTCVSFSQDWETYFSDSTIEIQIAQVTYEKPSHNRSHERIAFKYINNTNEDVTVSFNRPNEYDGVKSVASEERTFTLSIPANSELHYDDQNKGKSFYLFLKDNNLTIKRALTWFDIENIQYL